jgi:hypothetical protein
MCKIAAIVDASNIVLNQKVISAFQRAVTKTDQHGFGWSVSGSVGTKVKLYGERTSAPDRFKPLMKPKKRPNGLVEAWHDSFGDSKALLSPLSAMFHGRFSTNTRSLSNTHPFVSDDLSLSLIHNGVVTDAEGAVPETELRTDNDSEILLRLWEKGGVADIERNVGGYYAISALNTAGELHIVRDDQARLHISWVRTIKSWVIATTPEIIESACKELGWKHDLPDPISENTYAVFKDGAIQSSRLIEPRPKPATMSDQAKLALGSKSYPVSAVTEADWNKYAAYDDADIPSYRPAKSIGYGY